MGLSLPLEIKGAILKGLYRTKVAGNLSVKCHTDEFWNDLLLVKQIYTFKQAKDFEVTDNFRDRKKEKKV